MDCAWKSIDLRNLLVAATFVFAAGTAACSEDETSGGVGGSSDDGAGGAAAACDAFVPGTNMLALDWTDEEAGGDGDEEVGVVVQSAGDLARASEVVLDELAHACADAAVAFGRERPETSDIVTREEAVTACATTHADVADALEAHGATLEAGAAGCAAEDAETACRAECSGEATCDAYCASAVAHLAACPAAPMTVRIDGATVTPMDAELVAVVEVVGRVLGARARLELMDDAVLALTQSADAESLAALNASCLPRVVGAVSDGSEDRTAAVEIITDVASTLD